MCSHANAGPDQTVFVASTVTLDGSASTDVDGNPLTYSWALNSVPPGSAATLNNPTAIKPTFGVDKPGVYVAQLVVNDGQVNSSPDTVSSTVAAGTSGTNLALAATATASSQNTTTGQTANTLSARLVPIPPASSPK